MNNVHNEQGITTMNNVVHFIRISQDILQQTRHTLTADDSSAVDYANQKVTKILTAIERVLSDHVYFDSASNIEHVKVSNVATEHGND